MGDWAQLSCTRTTLQLSRKTQNPRVRQGQILVMVENRGGHDKNWFAVINRLPRWFNSDPSITCPRSDNYQIVVHVSVIFYHVHFIVASINCTWQSWKFTPVNYMYRLWKIFLKKSSLIIIIKTFLVYQFEIEVTSLVRLYMYVGRFNKIILNYGERNSHFR